LNDEDTVTLGNVVPPDVGAPASAAGRPILHDPDYALEFKEPLAKVGRTTCWTEGELNAEGLDSVPVLVPGIGLVYFDNCLEVFGAAPDAKFARDGDSGSVVFSRKSWNAVGLHFAGAQMTQEDGSMREVSYACDLTAVLIALKLTWG
jgi:hypothetical protein